MGFNPDREWYEVQIAEHERVIAKTFKDRHQMGLPAARNVVTYLAAGLRGLREQIDEARETEMPFCSCHGVMVDETIMVRALVDFGFYQVNPGHWRSYGDAGFAILFGTTDKGERFATTVDEVNGYQKRIHGFDRPMGFTGQVAWDDIIAYIHP